MRFQKYLQEEYLTMIQFHLNGKMYDIFKNPDRSEIMDILKEQRKDPLNEPDEFRFLVDKKSGDWFVFSYRVNHKEAAVLGLRRPDVHTNFYSAVGKLNGAKGLRWSHFWQLSDKDIETCNEFLKAKGWKAEHVKGSKFFNEEYVTSWKATAHATWEGGQTEIFCNPSNSELTSIIKNTKSPMVRIFLDLDDRKLYVWRASTVHHKAISVLLKDGIELRNYIKATAKIEGNKLALADHNDKWFDTPEIIEEDLPLVTQGEVEEFLHHENLSWCQHWFKDDLKDYIANNYLFEQDDYNSDEYPGSEGWDN